ncbi:right-handed parallel beta-helix repeat-containing protein [Luteibacter yeojuensis]|uniref:Right-handed parallel beta-helix repeat-containing protein n=1 Tax=Luteibacter yeojuensis TaxID=345309 RepID=A0A7X5QSH9_9GAMM|nr:right-handed parallel beta-helix repeat-containing protein [Luteibacter yeojuensis]NID14574.1 right-handed parallel beta-helix repeat-containing protein [Luteibacter yeojuensis]
MERRTFLQRSAYTLALVAIRPLHALAAGGTPGRSYYVDGASGDDGRDAGSATQAWRSLGRLNQARFGPGDRIFFRRGADYPGVFAPKGSGHAGAPIVVDAYGDGAPPHLHADGSAASTVLLRNVEYWTLRNLSISNRGAAAAPRRTAVHLLHDDVGVVHGIELRGLHIHDVNGSPIKRDGGGSAILVEAKGKGRPTRHEGLLILDNTIERCQRDGILFLRAGNRAGGLATGVIVRGNRLSGVPGDCILVKGCDGALVERNTVSRCGDLPRGEAAAGIWPFDCDNTTIQYNEVSDHKAHADGQAYDADFHCRGTIIQYNYSHDNVGGMALVCNDGRDPKGIGNSGTIVRYNVSINDALRKTGSASLRISGPVDGSQVYNNIIIIPAKPDAGAEVTVFKATSWKGVPSSTAIHDNIVVAPSPPGIDMKLATQTRLGENHFAENKAMLESFRTHRPSLAQVNALVKACFVNGKPAADAMERIARLA